MTSTTRHHTAIDCVHRCVLDLTRHLLNAPTQHKAFLWAHHHLACPRDHQVIRRGIYLSGIDHIAQPFQRDIRTNHASHLARRRVEGQDIRAEHHFCTRVVVVGLTPIAVLTTAAHPVPFRIQIVVRRRSNLAQLHRAL